MSYTALYRKFRPADFSDVKGQDHIVTTLKNQLKMGRIGHAYLFTGTRGTGKTSVAKIMAKAVNCEHPTENGPCNECAMCKAIQAQASMNVFELDAASNNSVDNIREIVDAVQYSPAEGRYKVYIIDEVHMLSTGAFNALLKTLEEPPSYVIFILATTEVHKIPITILSRCQRYDFHRISIDTITDRLRYLVDSEGVRSEEKALRYIAKTADGSMRDGVSLLDQCIAFYLGEELTYERVLDVLGAVDVSVFDRLLNAVAAGDVRGAVKVVEDVVMQGREITWFVNEFTWYLRNLLLVNIADDCEELIEMSTDNLNALKESAEKISSETLVRYIRIMSELSGTLRYSGQKRVLFEIAIVKLCRPQMETDAGSLKERINDLEQQFEDIEEKAAAGVFASAGSGVAGNNNTGSGMPGSGATGDAGAQPIKPKPVPIALSEDIAQIAKNWREITEKLSPATNSIIRSFTLSIPEGDPSSILLVTKSDVAADILTSKMAYDELSKCVEGYIGKKANIIIKKIKSEEENRGIYPDIEKLVKKGIAVEIE